MTTLAIHTSVKLLSTAINGILQSQPHHRKASQKLII